MRIVLQKVLRGMVEVDGAVIGEIAEGYVLLVGITHGDTEADALKLAEKVLKLKLFADDGSETFMQKNIIEAEGSLLVIPQFTLYGSCKKGTKPNFTEAAPPEEARDLFAHFVEILKGTGMPVDIGAFGEHMEVTLTNKGPITLILES